MKNFFFLLILLLNLSSCSTLEEDKIQQSVYAEGYKDMLENEEVVVIDIDAAKNFAELRSQMEKLACEDKPSGLRFSIDNTEYFLTGNTPCPKPGEISCYFQQIQISILNDSIVRSPFGISKEPIENLEELLTEIVSKPYFLRLRQEVMKPALIHFYVEEKEDIATTKKVLAQVTDTFAKINSAEKSGFFQYDILFTRSSPIPPPPPPLEAPE